MMLAKMSPPRRDDRPEKPKKQESFQFERFYPCSLADLGQKSFANSHQFGVAMFGELAIVLCIAMVVSFIPRRREVA